MSTYMQLIVEVTTGDDLVLDPLKRGEQVLIVTQPEITNSHILGEKVMATIHNVAYVPEEALE